MIRPIPRTLATLAVVASCALFATSCSSENDGEFTFGTPLDYQDCFDRLDPMVPAFFAARDRIDSVGVFVQSRPDVQADADLVHIEVYRAPDDVSKIEGQELTMAGAEQQNPNIRAALAVNASCPDLAKSFELRGTIVFDEIGAKKGDTVRGELFDASVVQVSDDDPPRTVVEDVTGRWEFTVRGGAPYRNYPTFDDEYRRSP